MIPSIALTFLIVLAGVLAQTVSGFGLGLVMMPLLVTVVGLETARPLIALVGVAAQFIILFRMREFFQVRTIGMMSVLGLIGIPVGSWIADSSILNERTLILILALIVIAYAVYSLFAFTIPRLKDERWSGVFGFASGVLSGAYNMGGPPIVIYADARGWTPEMVRTNLQGFFLVKNILLVITHAVSGNLVATVWLDFAWTIPAILLGLVLGFAVAHRINKERFRQIVLIMLLVVGVNMLIDLLRAG